MLPEVPVHARLAELASPQPELHLLRRPGYAL